MSIQENLLALRGQAIKDRNFVNYYLTFRQQRSNRVSDIDSLSIAGYLISIATGRNIKPKRSLTHFIDACQTRLSSKIGNEQFESLLSKMYFENDAKGLYQSSPNFLLFKNHIEGSVNTKHVSSVLGSMIDEHTRKLSITSQGCNFLESELLDELSNFLIEKHYVSNVENYLPFLSDVFSKDFEFLCRYPNYFMQNTTAFLSLYNFLYSSQLALNIRNWRLLPSSKPLFFILDTERASSERTNVRDALPSLLDKVADLFPTLSALEYLNQPDAKDPDTLSKYPLWRFYEYLLNCEPDEQSEYLEVLVLFLNAYRGARKREQLANTPASIEETFEAIIKTAEEVFSQPRSNQLTVNKKVVLAFENEVARHFIQNRRRGGRVLIMNQDYLLMLTNIAIGNEEKIQLQQLVEEFKKRGVWFDQQSQQALIEFYERVGNLDRMSDSGDAVYVRKTI
jgi:DNA phosphorothioation-dependent restriction protein DptG